MKLRLCLLPLLLIMPAAAHALGLGKLQLESALNEPLRARIELLSATAEDIIGMNVALANDAAFKHAGIPREYYLSKINFSVQESEAGPDYILVYTDEPMREPFLNFLVEVSWPNGRLYREYTVLLDPPLYVAEEMRKQVKPPSVTTTREAAPETTGPATGAAKEEHTVVY